MAVVVDANVLVALATDDDRAPVVAALLENWLGSDEELHAPTLLRYEVANALTRLVVAGLYPERGVERAWRLVVDIPVGYHPLEHGPAVIRIALSLGRRSAYDAAYILLASRLGAELWTLDGPLYRNASALGFPVRLAG